MVRCISKVEPKSIKKSIPFALNTVNLKKKRRKEVSIIVLAFIRNVPLNNYRV